MEFNTVKANPVSRIGSALIDLMLFFVILMLSASLIVSPIINSTSAYQETYASYQEKLVDTFLVVKTDTGLITRFDYDQEKNEDFDYKNMSKYDNYIIDFYYSYESNDKVEEFKQAQRDATYIFTFNENGSYEITGKDEDVISFYNNQFSKALNDYYELDQEYASLYNEIDKYNSISMYCSGAISLLITYLFFPLVLKHGRTLGKQIFSLRVVNDNAELSNISLLQKLIRFAVSALILVVSYFTTGIPLFIVLIFMLTNKKSMGIQDIVAKTVVLDGVKIKQYYGVQDIR